MSPAARSPGGRDAGAPGDRPAGDSPAATPRARRLAVVVSTPAASGDLARAIALAGAACDAGVEIGMFFMDEAVAGLPAAREALGALADAGCELVACASSAHARGLSEADAGVLLGSQDDHAALVHRADRVVAFT